MMIAIVKCVLGVSVHWLVIILLHNLVGENIQIREAILKVKNYSSCLKNPSLGFTFQKRLIEDQKQPGPP